jgi:diguanylate cyclase (GGDEF)-like protein
MSASFGVAFTGESGYELRQLLVDADQALYRAKRAGRNCVVAGKQGEGVVA